MLYLKDNLRTIYSYRYENKQVAGCEALDTANKLGEFVNIRDYNSICILAKAIIDNDSPSFDEDCYDKVYITLLSLYRAKKELNEI